MHLLILLFARIYYDETDEDYSLYFSIQFVATCLTLLGNSIPMIGRIKWMFSLPAIVFLPLIITKIQNRKTKLIWMMGIFVLFFFYAEVVVGIKGAYGVIPYNSIFS